LGNPVPVEINHVKSQGIVRMTWSDGHVGEYPKAYLRGYCPCALCQGHDSSVEKRFVEAPDVELIGIESVGNYAVSFVWADGHRTGIYTFDYLRDLCPCPECEGKAGS
jgi:DUF971 family protein